MGFVISDHDQSCLVISKRFEGQNDLRISNSHCPVSTFCALYQIRIYPGPSLIYVCAFIDVDDCCSFFVGFRQILNFNLFKIKMRKSFFNLKKG